MAPKHEVNIVFEKHILEIVPQFTGNRLVSRVTVITVSKHTLLVANCKTEAYLCESIYIGRCPEKMSQGVFDRSTFLRSFSSHFHCVEPTVKLCSVDINVKWTKP